MAVRPPFAFPASFRVVSPLWRGLGFCPDCPLAVFRLVGVFLVPRFLYWCGSGKTAYQSGVVLGSVFLRRVWCGCGFGVRSALVAGLLSGSFALTAFCGGCSGACFRFRWCVYQGGRLSGRLYGIAG